MDTENVSNIINQHEFNDIYGTDINVIKHFIKKKKQTSTVSIPLINKAATDSILSNCRKY